MLLITRHELHQLLVNFKQPNTCTNFYTGKSLIRSTISLLRGDMERHQLEGFRYLDEPLSHEEMLQLIETIQNTLSTSQVSDLSVVDNQMLHSLMCDKLIASILEYQTNNLKDRFLEVITEYFFKLNKALQLAGEHSRQAIFLNKS